MAERLARPLRTDTRPGLAAQKVSEVLEVRGRTSTRVPSQHSRSRPRPSRTRSMGAKQGGRTHPPQTLRLRGVDAGVVRGEVFCRVGGRSLWRVDRGSGRTEVGSEDTQGLWLSRGRTEASRRPESRAAGCGKVGRTRSRGPRRWVTLRPPRAGVHPTRPGTAWDGEHGEGPGVGETSRPPGRRTPSQSL